MREYHVLNLGAGVQSTMLYLLACEGHKVMPRIDVAIFADTGDEPQAVYRHLEWLEGLGGPQILRVSRNGNRLGDDLLARDRNAELPCFTEGGGQMRRNCSGNYKRDVIIKAIRQDMCGVGFRKRMPSDIRIHQYLGLSFDEAKRVLKYRARSDAKMPWNVPHFPLFETNTTRTHCIAWLGRQGIPHKCPRSACVFCPYRLNTEWQDVAANKADHDRAVHIDNSLRRMWPELGEAFLHKTCVPLCEADISTIEPHPEFAFVGECEGMCGI